MPTSFEKLQMGPCEVTFKDTDLGLTKGGVEVQISTEISNITADQFGSSAIDDIVQGRAVMVKVPMAERDLDNFLLVFPGATLVTGAGDQKKLVINSSTGQSLRELAGPLKLHPKGQASAQYDVNVAIASAKGDMTFTFNSEDQRVYTAEFTGYVDLDTDELLTFGDPAITAA